LSCTISDPTAAANVVRVVIISQQFHDLLRIDVAKIVKCEE